MKTFIRTAIIIKSGRVSMLTKKKILICSFITVAFLIGVSFNSIVEYNAVKSDVKALSFFTIRASRAIDEESKDCNCQDVIGDNSEKNEKLLARIEIYCKIILSRYTHKPEVTEKCKEIMDIVNSDDIWDIFCYVLMRIGILIEKLGEKVPHFGFIFYILELIMIPIVILWNMYCD
jgi:hypothetical protein